MLDEMPDEGGLVLPPPKARAGHGGERRDRGWRGVRHRALHSCVRLLLGIESGALAGRYATASSRVGAATNCRTSREQCAFKRYQTIKSGLASCRRKAGSAAKTARVCTVPVWWRAWSRPSGLTTTTLETSRPRLTRRATGVRPRRAHAAGRRGRKACPVSSHEATVRPSRAAFVLQRRPAVQQRLDDEPPALGSDAPLMRLAVE